MSKEISSIFGLFFIILTVVGCDVIDVEDEENSLRITEPVFNVVDLNQIGINEAKDINDEGDIIGGTYFWNNSSQSLHQLYFTTKSLNNSGHVTGNLNGKAYFWEVEDGVQLISHPYKDYNIVGEWIIPYGINNHGEVVGESSIVDAIHDEEYDDTIYIDTYEAFQWSSGATAYDMIEHGGRANDINDNGQIVGTHPMGAFKWDSNHYITFLESSDGGFEEALAINNHGQIVGSVLHSDDHNITELINDILITQRFTESKGVYDTSHLISLLRDGNSSAKGLNDIGLTRLGSFSLRNMQNENLLSVLNEEQQLNSIQNVVNNTYESEAFLWDDEYGNQSLGTLEGGTWSTAFDINDHGQVVGYSDIGNEEYRAFYWDQENGMIELPSNGKNSIARAINNNGQIVGENDGPVMWEVSLPQGN